MAKRIDWETRIGRRLRLRDLHAFYAVAQAGSMAKAAAQLGVSQPAVSEVIADLEQTLRVRLFDRNPRGVEPTIYGRSLLARTLTVFDELKQGVRDLEFLADPTAGEVRIGCPESIAAAFLPPVLLRFMEEHPGIVVDVKQVVTPTLELPELRARALDFVIARIGTSPVPKLSDDLDLEILFEDELVLAAGLQSRWARRRKLELAELISAPWLLTAADTWNLLRVEEAFQASRLNMPKVTLTTFSVHLKTYLLAARDFVTALPRSVVELNAARFGLKVLPVQLPNRPWPVAIVTLKNRTLSPVVQLFIEHLRAFTKTKALGLRSGKVDDGQRRGAI
jgi:DNA-binding transcriptional LysR family regulator